MSDIRKETATAYPSADALTGSETVMVVQDGHTKKTTMNDIRTFYLMGTEGQGVVISATGQSYTAPFDGFVSATLTGNNASTPATIRVGGLAVIRSYTTTVYQIFPVKKGQVITSTGTGTFEVYYSK